MIAGAASVGAVAHVFVGDLGDECTVDGPDGHHLARVRRLTVGEVVTASDGMGTWRPYRVRDAVRDRLELVATGPPVYETIVPPRIAVAFAITKGDRPEQVTQQLTELGVDRILPMHTVRTVVRWDANRAEKANAKLTRVAREAAAQCRRSWLPVVEAVASFEDVVRHPSLVLADSNGGSVNALSEPPGGEWLAIVGPEGGFEPAERRKMAHADVVAVGSHVLRSETAAVAIASVLTGMFRQGHSERL